MSLQEKIHQDLIEATKKKDALTRDTLRLVESMLKNEQIELQKELADADVEKVLARAIKSRKESAEEYKKVDQKERADQELAEAELISKYLPEQMSEEEIAKLVKETIEKVGAAGPQDMGKVMGALMPQVQGKADGKLVQELVKKILAG